MTAAIPSADSLRLRTAGRLLAAGLLLLLGPASAQAREHPKNPFESKAELEKSMAELRPFLDKLRGLKARYDDSSGLSKVLAERQSLRMDLQTQLEEFRSMNADFRRLKQ